MKVICKDGTTIQCQQFRATDSGVLLFEESPGDDEDEEEAFTEATGFVPNTELRYVLPDRVTPGGRTAQQREQPAAPLGPQQRQGGPQSEQRGGPGSGGRAGGQQPPHGGQR